MTLTQAAGEATRPKDSSTPRYPLDVDVAFFDPAPWPLSSAYCFFFTTLVLPGSVRTAPLTLPAASCWNSMLKVL